MIILPRLGMAVALALTLTTGCSQPPGPLPNEVAALENRFAQGTGDSLSQAMIEEVGKERSKKLQEYYGDHTLLQYAKGIAWSQPLQSLLCQMLCSDFRTNKEHLDVLVPRLALMTQGVLTFGLATLDVIFDKDFGFKDRAVVFDAFGDVPDGNVVLFMFVVNKMTDAELERALDGGYGNGILRIIAIQTILDQCGNDNVKRAEEVSKYREFLAHAQNDVGRYVLRFNELTLEGKGHEELISDARSWMDQRDALFHAEWQRHISTPGPATGP